MLFFSTRAMICFFLATIVTGGSISGWSCRAAELQYPLSIAVASNGDVFLADLGMAEPGLDRVIRAAYQLLRLQTFFTAGVKEVRAWTVSVGATAPQGAGVIHTDFERGFIRAEVTSFDDMVASGIIVGIVHCLLEHCAVYDALSTSIATPTDAYRVSSLEAIVVAHLATVATSYTARQW